MLFRVSSNLCFNNDVSYMMPFSSPWTCVTINKSSPWKLGYEVPRTHYILSVKCKHFMSIASRWHLTFQFFYYLLLLSFQFSHSVMPNSASPWTAASQASLSITHSWGLLKLMSIELVMPSNHLILCHPLFLLPSIFSSIRVFSNELVLHIRWTKYWSFSISPSNEYSGLISFKLYWLDLLEVQGTLKSSPTP